ncbi:MAG: diadenylate cyclase [bacterium]|nr:diadenylate cyclase [bacterium]
MVQPLIADILDIFQNLSVLNFHLKDLFDILVVAFLIYAVLLLLKRTHSFFILGGIIILALVYFIARFFNFYLTGLLFQSFFASFIVILVIIFQKELRNFFEWLSVLGRGLTRREIVFDFSIANQVAEAVAYLVHHKIGALIVLAGKQPLDRLIEGGASLNGEVSAPLLLSLFDPSSPGHDGAAVIEGNKLKKFSAHLPLATRFKKFGNLGTRHRAALGLAQVSDALVIVVSEEKGAVSVALQGDLKTLSNAEELNIVLDRFLKKEMKGEKPRWQKWFAENLREKIIAGVLAVALWFVFAFQFGTINQEFKIPIEFRFLAKDLIIENVKPLEIVLTLSGRSQDFKLLNSKDLKVLIDASAFKEGTNKVKIEQNFISRPAGLKITDFSPETIQVSTKTADENQ